MDEVGRAITHKITWKVSERAIILAGKHCGKGTNDEENQNTQEQLSIAQKVGRKIPQKSLSASFLPTDVAVR